MKNWLTSLSLVIISSFLLILIWVIYSVFMLHNVSIYSENGPLEALQAILLAFSCIIFLTPLVFQKDPEKLILCFCSLLCYSFMVRELDIERLNVHNFLKIIGSGVGRNATLAVAFTSLIVYAATKFSYYKQACFYFVRSKSGIFLLSGGLFLIIGGVFEKSHSIMYNVLFEELFELFGYSLILLSAFAANDTTAHPARRKH